MTKIKRTGENAPALQFASVLEHWKQLQTDIIAAVPSDAISQKIAKQVSKCGLSFAVRAYFDDGTLSSRSFFTCQKRLACPLCAKRLARKLAFAICDQLKLFDGDDFQLVTITQKGHVSKKVAINAIRETHKSFMKAWRNSRSRGTFETFFMHYSGGFFSLEVKRGKNSGLWHPHIHYLMHGRGKLTSDFKCAMDHPLSSELRMRNEFDGYICDVRDVERDEAGSLLPALFEVCKYIHDFKSSPSDIWDIVQELRGLRSRGSFGDLRGVKIPQNPDDDFMDEDDVRQFVEYLIKWDSEEYYIKSKTLQNV